MDDETYISGIDAAMPASTRDSPASPYWGAISLPSPRHFEAPPRPARGLSSKSLTRARQFMEHNIGSNFTLEQLAKAACVSRAHFARLFRVSTGTTPMAYLLKMRIEHAKPLLLRRQRVSDVAAALGFCDQSHFSRVFRRTTGLTPREFARINR